MKIVEDGVARRGRKIDEAEAASRRMELLEAAAN